MRLVSTCAAAVLLPILATTVHAGDPGTVTDWSGFYAGIFGGQGNGVILPVGLGEEEAPGKIAGVQFGFNVQKDMLVFGVQTELTKSWMAWTDETPPDTIDWLGSTTARVGLALGPILPYVKAGIAYGGGTGNYSIYTSTATMSGWTYGAGAEIAVSDNVALFGEYAHYDLGPGTLDFGGTPIEVSATASVVKVGVDVGF